MEILWTRFKLIILKDIKWDLIGKMIGIESVK